MKIFQIKRAICICKSMVFLLFVISGISPYSFAQQPLIQNLELGEVNWTDQVIRAKGYGAPNPDAPNIAAARLGAQRAAKVDALRNVLEVIKGVSIDSETLVVNAMTKNDVIRSQVQGIVQGARVIDMKNMPDGAVVVMVEVPLTGELAQTLLIPNSFGQQKVPKAGNSIYTGLVIDATGLGLKPAMSPKVLDEDGLLVYGAVTVTREWATKYGIAGYAKDLETAKTNDRVAGNPLIIKAQKATGKSRCDLVVNSADAKGLRDMTRNLSFLEQCRVIIVVD
jgi:hypothetical protein